MGKIKAKTLRHAHTLLQAVVSPLHRNAEQFREFEANCGHILQTEAIRLSVDGVIREELATNANAKFSNPQVYRDVTRQLENFYTILRRGERVWTRAIQTRPDCEHHVSAILRGFMFALPLVNSHVFPLYVDLEAAFAKDVDVNALVADEVAGFLSMTRAELQQHNPDDSNMHGVLSALFKRRMHLMLVLDKVEAVWQGDGSPRQHAFVMMHRLSKSVGETGLVICSSQPMLRSLIQGVPVPGFAQRWGLDSGKIQFTQVPNPYYRKVQPQ